MSNPAHQLVGDHWCAHATNNGGWIVYTDDVGDPILDALDTLTAEGEWEITALAGGGWLIEPTKTTLVTIR